MPGPGAAPPYKPARSRRGRSGDREPPPCDRRHREHCGRGWYSSRMPATGFEDFANECIGIARRARGTRDGDAMWRMARAWLLIVQVMARREGQAEPAPLRAIYR